nr:methylmalonyl-CoA epimerase [Desulfobacterales bacterium]
MDWKDWQVHHIGIVVEDIDEAKKTYEEVFGLEVVNVFDVEAFSAKVAFLPVKNTYIELVQPTNPEDGLGKFLKRGGGMHHICYEVEDIDAAMEELKKKNVRSVTGEPQHTPCFEKVLFLHPKDTGNVLIEVVEKATCKLPGAKY